jgi:Flp pilus assembly protein TadG
MNIGRSRRYGPQEGASAVEGVLTISVLLLVILGVVECGQILWVYNTILLATEEAGRYAMLYNRRPTGPCDPQSQAPRCPTLSNTALANCSAARAQQVLSTHQVSNAEVSVTEDRTAFPGTATICTSYSGGLVMAPLFPNGVLKLTRQVTVPVI